MAKRSKSGAGVFKDIQARTVAETFGGITAVMPPDGSPQTGNVLLEMTGFVGVVSGAAQAWDFLVKIAVTPATAGGVPVAIAQNSTILQPGGYAQFTLTTVHQSPPQGTYLLVASIEARAPGQVVPIDRREAHYRVT